MRIGVRLGLQFAGVLVALAVVLGLAVPRVAERTLTADVGPLLQRQAEGVARLLALRQSGPMGRVPLRLAEIYVDGEVVVADPRGVVIWNSQTLAGDLRGRRLEPHLTARADRPGFAAATVAGSQAVVAWAPIRRPGADAGAARATVLIYRPMRELGPVTRQLARAFLGWLLVALGTALAAGLAVGWGLVRRLRRLQAAAARLAEGDLSQRAHVGGTDEIAELAGQFDRMAARMQGLVEGLRRAESTRRAMLAAVSHELRTPVTVIRGFGEALRDGVGGTGEELQRRANAIVREAERLGRLIDDLFQLARIEAGQLDVRLSRLDVAAWLRESVPRLEGVAGGFGARLDVRIDSALAGLHAYADRDRLEQVLVNLVENAVRHAGDSGDVRVEARREDGRVRVAVADGGPGIDPEDLPHLFEPFYRGREAARSRGAGLGLAIARAIVEAHGGEIGVESAPGRGATFWFTLPLAPGGRDGRGAGAPAPGLGPGAGGRGS